MPIDNPDLIELRDEGVVKGLVRAVDVTGAGATASVAAGVGTINVPGGGGGAVAIAEVEVDFGVSPTDSVERVVVDAAVLATSKVMVNQSMASPSTAADQTPFRSFTSATVVTAGDRTDLAIAAPAGLVEGDLLLLIVYENTAGQLPAVGVPTGFEPIFVPPSPYGLQISRDVRVWAKRAGAAEPANYTVTLYEVGGVLVIAAMLAFQNSGHEMGLGFFNDAALGDTAQTYGPISTLLPNEHLVVIYASRYTVTPGWTAGPAGLVDRTGDLSIAGAASIDMRVWSGPIAVAGAQSGTATHAESRVWNSLALVLFALDPDEALAEPMVVYAKDIAAGQFTLVAEALEGPVAGRYKFSYLVG